MKLFTFGLASSILALCAFLRAEDAASKPKPVDQAIMLRYWTARANNAEAVANFQGSLSMQQRQLLEKSAAAGKAQQAALQEAKTFCGGDVLYGPEGEPMVCKPADFKEQHPRSQGAPNSKLGEKQVANP